MKQKPRTLMLEDGSEQGLIQILSVGAGVYVRIDGKELVVTVRVNHGDDYEERSNSSTWDEQEIRMGVKP